MDPSGLKLYQVTLRTRGTTLSRWQADTVWGHLCWWLRHLHGEPALTAWLARYHAGEPPLLVSDGFPGDAFPVPLLPPHPDRRPTAEELKAVRRTRWLTREGFLHARTEGWVNPDHAAVTWDEHVAWKNTVSRKEWTALSQPESGGLFALREQRPPGNEVTLYIRTSDADYTLVEELFHHFETAGFGKRRSIGYGQITGVTIEPEPDLDRVPANANGWITLSPFIPRPHDPTEGYYDLRMKHGRFGDELPGLPWKVPLMFVTTGSCFYDDNRSGWYGGLEESIAIQDPTGARAAAVQYAYGFPVAAAISRPAAMQV